MSKPEGVDRKYGSRLPKQAMGFMKSLLAMDTRDRLSWHGMLTHPYFEGMDGYNASCPGGAERLGEVNSGGSRRTISRGGSSSGDRGRSNSGRSEKENRGGAESSTGLTGIGGGGAGGAVHGSSRASPEEEEDKRRAARIRENATRLQREREEEEARERERDLEIQRTRERARVLPLA